MGLLDQILGGAAGAPRGRRGGGAGSPVVKALMLALAAKAAQQYMQGRRSAGTARPADRHETGGGLPGGLGGVLAGLGGAGALGALVEQFRNAGHGGAIDSWIGRGRNERLPPRQLAEALGPEALDELEVETGMNREQLLSELSDELPDAVDKLTPDGRLPDDQEIGRLLS